MGGISVWNLDEVLDVLYGMRGACEGQGQFMSVARELAEYELYLEGVREVRCDYAITESEGDYIFF